MVMVVTMRAVLVMRFNAGPRLGSKGGKGKGAKTGNVNMCVGKLTTNGSTTLYCIEGTKIGDNY